MAKKDEEYVSYADAVRALEKQKQTDEPLFTDDELKKIAPYQSTLKDRVAARQAAKQASKKKDFTETPLGIGLGIGGLLLFVAYIAVENTKPDLPAYPEQTAAPSTAVAPTPAPVISTKQEKINRQFSGWDGSHYDLVKRTKAAMHDPASFDHVKTNYVEAKGYLLISMEYRGKNMLGATIKNNEIAYYTVDGEFVALHPE